MNLIGCICGGSLELDLEESRKHNTQAVHACLRCGRIYILQLIGEKPRGWMTKKKLENQKLIQSIPF